MTTGDLTRPIVGIENRTAAEVFGIMCDRIRHAHAREAGAQEPVAVPAGWDALDASIASLKAQHAALASAIAEFEHAVMTIIVNVRRKPACTPDELEKWWYDEKLPRIRAMLAAPPVSPPPDHSEDALDMVKAPPAESGGVDDAWREAGEKQLQVHEALRDSAYRAGARAGWNAQFAADPDAAIEQLTRYPKGALAVIHEKHAREKCAFHTPAPQPGGAVKVTDAMVDRAHAAQPGLSTEMVRKILHAALVLSPSPSGWDAGAWQPTHRHVKRGSEYRMIGEAEAQVSTGGYNGLAEDERKLREGDSLTVYQGADGKLWVRFTDEFSDGRFLPLPTPPAGEG